MNDTLSTSRQESILSVLCFNKVEAQLIAEHLTPNMFGSAIYRDIAIRAMQYLETYRDVIGPHMAEEFEDVLESEDDAKADLYDEVIHNLNEFKDDVNPTYVVNNIKEFIRTQTLKSSVVEVAALLKEDKLEEAEAVYEKARSTTLAVFQPGLVFKEDPQRFVSAHDNVPDSISTGIPHFDYRNIGLTPGESLVILAPPNRGKSWALIHLGKFALLARKKVLHITLEMSEDRVAQRYMQSILSIGYKESRTQVSVFGTDNAGRFLSMSRDTVERPCYQDSNIRKFLQEKLGLLSNRLQLVVKQFPTSQLTMAGLLGYLDMLERYNSFIPDVVILDYADLMKVRQDSIRGDLSLLHKELRGEIAVARNIAFGTASQTNRMGEDSRVCTLKHLAEDYTKAATADIIISYNQTREEQALGLARLFSAKVRNEQKEETVVISQAYQIGQFALQSALVTGDYWESVDREMEDR